ncbi:hypothetical protein GGI07_002854 [Coemansia sp. Benny D115]|nr:hypothetical protein GGI07_002854 [Coemansia sp. Benny D115]
MANISAIDTTMPVEAPDSPIITHLEKRGRVDIADKEQERPLHLYYEIYGRGSRRVVFVNGMGADRQMWEPDVAELLKHKDKYQCLVYDHRGTGFSDNSDAGILGYTSSKLAQDLKRLLDALQWNAVNLVGASMGGMIAMEFACRYPELLNTLTLVVTNAGLTVPPAKGIRDTIGANFVSDPLERFRGICGSLYTTEYLQGPAPEGSEHKNMLEYCAHNAVRRSKYTRPMSFWSFLGQVGVVFRHYVSPARLQMLGKLLPKNHILIVTGDQDTLVRTSNSAYLADKIGRDRVIFEIFEGAAHGLNSQEAAKLIRCIDSMITQAEET